MVIGTVAASWALAGASRLTTPSPGAIGATAKRLARTFCHTGLASGSGSYPWAVPAANVQAHSARQSIRIIAALHGAQLLFQEAALPGAVLDLTESRDHLAPILHVAHDATALPRDGGRVGDGRQIHPGL